MDVDDSDNDTGYEFGEPGDSDSDQEDVSNIIRYLIRRGRFSTEGSLSVPDISSFDEFQPSSHQSKYEIYHPDTSKIKESDLNHTILLNSGSFNDRASPSSGMNSVPSMLRMREVGMNKREHFSLGDQCQITQRVLPNKMQILDRYDGKVFCGTFAMNGDVFLSAAQDYCIRLYDTSNGFFKLHNTVEAKDVGWSILDTAVSPDGTKFVYCSWSESIYICSIYDDQQHAPLPVLPEDRRFCIFALRFSQDGSEILSGSNDECLYIFNRELNRRTLRIKSHEDDVNSVAFSDNSSQILFSAGDDGICKVWDRRTLCERSPKPVGILVGHEDGITYVDSKGDGRHLITNSKDQTIKLWDLRAFSPNSSLQLAYNAVKSHNWDYRWQKVPHSLHKVTRKLPGDTSLMTYRGHSVMQTLIRCHFSPETTTGQSYIYTGCAQGRVIVYDILTGKIKASLKGHKACVRDVSWHPYRNEILSSSWDGTIVGWTYNKTEIDSDSEEWSKDSQSDESFRLRRSLRLAERRKAQT